MSDLQTKIGGGLSKLQDGLQQGKTKLQTAQEVSQLRKHASDAASNRMKVINQLGELTYRLLRKGEIQHSELNEQMERLLPYDLELYQANRSLSQMKKESSDHVCECGAPIQEEDTFCGSCGSKVLIVEPPEALATQPCDRCKEEVPETARFCGCCGLKNG
ncbi:zinc ribbon domain-containing protein [Bacillus sp. RAR_GA_16]|uniref:zinc ribbon domain-containing protein n=1 Tax=Bacillus sp. RAR_GA_16 TaxID=2876774 RepID=UPI001CCCBA21|nr:zinc ribbon domain-containing protein [Bacillus sp. RAR_GA_16]MCA0172854.1 zinc ribbon domain-containing protein [Bacillus sp. RAR_GA_16]